MTVPIDLSLNDVGISYCKLFKGWLYTYNIKLQLIFTNMAILTLQNIENSHLAKLHEIS